MEKIFPYTLCPKIFLPQKICLSVDIHTKWLRSPRGGSTRPARSPKNVKIFPSEWNGFQSAKEVVKPPWQVTNTPTHALEWPKKIFWPKKSKNNFSNRVHGRTGRTEIRAEKWPPGLISQNLILTPILVPRYFFKNSKGHFLDVVFENTSIATGPDSIGTSVQKLLAVKVEKTRKIRRTEFLGIFKKY
jgi:hypothetical protein